MLVQASKRWKILDVFLVGGAFGTLALGFWLYARYGFSPLAGITNGSVEPHKDFDVFLHSARALWEGGDVYSENGGPSISTNPPFWTVLVAPLTLLEPITAYRIFVLITVLAGVSSIGWMAAELGLRPAWAVGECTSVAKNASGSPRITRSPTAAGRIAAMPAPSSSPSSRGRG
jgi:hypothetical protein